MGLLKSTLLFAMGVVIIILTLNQRIKQTGTNEAEKTKKWLQEEHEANISRSKPIPSSLFLTIDYGNIPKVSSKSCLPLYEKLEHYSSIKIADLSNYSNLELKKRFGIAHFNELVRCEERYNQFLKDLFAYAEILLEENYLKETKLVLDYLKALGYHSKALDVLEQNLEAFKPIDK